MKLSITDREEKLIIDALKNSIATTKNLVKILTKEDYKLKELYIKEIADMRILLERLEDN